MRSLDIISGDISFYLKNEKKFWTRIGVFLSLLLISATVGAAIFFIQRFFSIDKPYLISNTVHQEKLTFNNVDKVTFAVRLSDQYGSAIPSDGVFEISYLWINTTSNPSGGLKQNYFLQNTSYCDIDKHFPENLKDLSLNYKDLNTFTCVDYTPGESFDLLNFYGGKLNYSFSGFLVVQCNTFDPNRGCLPQEEIDNLLVNTYLEIVIVDYTVSSTEETAVYPKLNLYRTAVSNQSYLRVWLGLAHGEYMTDTGLIFEDKNSLNYYTINVLKEQYKTLPKSQINQGLIEFAAVTLQNSEYKTFYLRSYVKLQEAFANFGGIVKGLAILAQTIYYIFGRKDYWRELIKLLPIQVSSKERFSENSGENTIKTNTLFPLKKLNLMKTALEKDFELTLIERIAPYMCYKSKRLILFEKKVSQVKNIFSADQIINNWFCLAEMKEIILQNNQSALIRLANCNRPVCKNQFDELLSKDENKISYKEKEMIGEIRISNSQS